MFRFSSWKSGTLVLIATITAGATAPIVTSASAFAQSDQYPDRSVDRSEQYPDRSEQYPDRSPDHYDRRLDRYDRYPERENQYQVSIPAGTRIPVRYNKSQKILVAPDETTSLTLTVASDITNRKGNVLVPSGTQIVGQLEPAEKGSRFVARELVFNSEQRRDIDATSRVITRTERITKGASSGSIIEGAAAGGAAAALISGVTGNHHIPVGAVLGGAGAGAVGGLLLGRRQGDVVVIYPERDLDLRLGSDLPVSY